MTDIIGRQPSFLGEEPFLDVGPSSFPVFAETFPQYIAEIETGGGSAMPETDRCAERAILVIKQDD